MWDLVQLICVGAVLCPVAVPIVIFMLYALKAAVVVGAGEEPPRMTHDEWVARFGRPDAGREPKMVTLIPRKK